ncbi:uncharacterized protein IUM83_06668 [Phytophthora cinnamomi]|uniref:uncharacterized protein n=1 Tax=Phytophthora cinnamomi TaxID=4785 RepID=UPI00355A479F|nr:hypothetical protein IUM83_06668 [Phytophthora cinnamomi]
MSNPRLVAFSAHPRTIKRFRRVLVEKMLVLKIRKITVLAWKMHRVEIQITVIPLKVEQNLPFEVFALRFASVQQPIKGA